MTRNRKSRAMAPGSNPTYWRGLSASERFEQRCLKSDGCWEWTGSKMRNGYGQTEFVVDGKRKVVTAHRLSYQLHKGAIGEGMFVCHACDNPGCVNPAHLFLGSHVDNMSDAKRKGRMHLGSAHGLAKLDESSVSEIKRLLRSGEKQQKEIASIYSVSSSAIQAIRAGRNWSHIQ